MQKIILLILTIGLICSLSCGQGNDNFSANTGGIDEGYTEFYSNSIVGHWVTVGEGMTPNVFWIFEPDGDFYSGVYHNDGYIHVDFCLTYWTDEISMHVDDHGEISSFMYVIQDNRLSVTLGTSVAVFVRSQPYPHMYMCD